MGQALAVQVQGQGSVSADNLNTYAQTADNVAAMRSFVGNAADGITVTVYMRGTTNPGDGGQGFFYWSPTSTAADDGGATTIVPTGQTVGAWLRLASNTSPSVTILTTGSSYTLTTSNYVLVVRKSVGSATTVNLPALPGMGQTYVIKDGKGDAATNNITISSPGPQIDGASSFIMAVNYESITVIFDGSNWNIT